MRGKLLTLFLQYENELRATVPDFAHQLSDILEVPPQKDVNYSNKPVAEYEIVRTFDSESENELHDDFENNVNFLVELSDYELESLFTKHFEGEADRDTMIAHLANNLDYNTIMSVKKPLRRKNATSESVEEPKKKKKKPKKKKKGLLRRMGEGISDIGREILGNEKVKVNLDELDVDTTPHCGTKKKKKEKIHHLYCNACEFEHTDIFRLCNNCGVEHEGCCDILA